MTDKKVNILAIACKRISGSIFIFIILIAILFGCGSGQDKDVIESDNIFPSRNINPLEHVFEILNIKSDDLVRPLYLEEGYHLICRNPLIDNLARSPFILQEWADNTSDAIQKRGHDGIAAMLQYMFEVMNNENPVESGSYEYSEYGLGAEAAYKWMYGTYGSVPPEASIRSIEKSGFSKAFDKNLGNLIYHIARGTVLLKKAFEALTPEEKKYISSKPERFFFPDGTSFNFLTAPVHIQKRIVSIARKIDFTSLHTAGLIAARAVDDFCRYCSKNNAKDGPFPFIEKGKTKGLIIDIPSPAGDIVVLGDDDNSCNKSCALLIDLGGDDSYKGPVASGINTPGRIAVAIDINGNDTFGDRAGKFSSGFGCLSIGIVADIRGDDQYIGGDMGQGCGMFGLGILRDGSGNDTYRMGLMGQGFAVFGAGLLLDEGGNDKYIMRGMGQGCASTLGTGVLCDANGNDKYLVDGDKHRSHLIADKDSHAQGAGFSIRSPDWTRHVSLYGGLGFLSDASGNDTYYASNGNVMGGSYFMSVGTLVDHKGNDKYLPENGNGAGFALHLSNGILIDREGNDYYSAKMQSGGAASDRSTALLIDYKGNDVYGPSFEWAMEQAKNASNQNKDLLSDIGLEKRAETKLSDTSYGSAKKPKAIGMLIDFQGNDRYFARYGGYGESLGGVVPPVDPEDWSLAVLMDLGGKDDYYNKGLIDNHYFNYYNHGICYDTEYKNGKSLFGHESRRQKGRLNVSEQVVEHISKSRIRNELSDLLKNDLYVRFSAVGNILRKGPDIVPDVTGVLMVSEHNELNRDLLEILTAFIADRRIRQKHKQYIISLLGARDPFVREYAATMLSTWHIRSAEPDLIQMLADPNETVRMFTIRALGGIGGEKSLIPLIDVFSKDPSLKCKRASIKTLGDILERQKTDAPGVLNEIEDFFLTQMAHSDERIRKSAASGMQYLPFNVSTERALEAGLNDDDVYVRRAAAKTLVLRGRKSGIPALIETLTFPSIDTFEHYDHELAKDLAYFCGVDFDAPERYEYSTWKQWWDDYGSGLDLKKNLDIMRKIEQAFTFKDEEEGIKIFNQLIKENPNNRVIQNRYKQFCFEWITFRLLTSEDISSSIKKRVERLKKIKVGLQVVNSQGKN